MSDENKDLNDDLNDMIGDAKEGTKKAVEKAEEVIEDAKDATEEFVEEAKETLSDGKNVAIISHITFIGWIIAVIMNGGDNKTELGSFYIRQNLGIFLLGIVLGIIPIINLFAWILPFVMWIVSLINSLGGKTTPVFLLGNKFQEWFKSL